MNNRTVLGIALVIIGLLGIAVMAPLITMSTYYGGYSPTTGGMMGGGTYPGMGGGMMGGGTYPGMMDNGSVSQYTGEPLTMDQAEYLAKQYLGSLNNPDLAIKEIMEFEYNFYIIYFEKSTGIGAFEMLIWKKTPTDMMGSGMMGGGMMGQGMMVGQIMPEPGPNMMWNTKYGGMMGHMSGMMSGDMMGSGMMGQQQPTGEMTIGNDEAKNIAQQNLDESFPGTTIEESTTFYGYYTLDFGMSGKIQGMLSVNGYTGQVWYHGWHGDFIQMKEFHE
jgi:hypothetical protein